MTQAAVQVPSAETVLTSLDDTHPRLILKRDGLEALKKQAETDPLVKAGVAALLKRAEDIRRRPALTYDKRGPRLLHVSRECLNRVYTLALAFRLTGRREFADAVRENILTVGRFPDWNPSHFLDTAEMSHAVGVGYDWCFDTLDEETRATIRAALIEKGLKPGLDGYATGGWWTTSEYNWNQVCNGGLIVGALGVAETDPEYARRIVPAAVRSLPRALASYAPDGAWGEGPGYWGYATMYTVFGLAALETALGRDFGLSEAKGLSEAGWFPIYTSGPTGLYFNFADVGERSRRGNLPWLFWLARRYRTAAFAEAEREEMKKRPGDPWDLIWYVPPGEKTEPLALDKVFRGRVEVAVFRSAWNDPSALFLAVKAGYNQVNHGHLDLGVFELDALGVRWARDLGSDDYNLPNYWEGKRGGRRWSYYRLNSLSHSVPLLDGKSQDADAVSRITAFRSTPAVAGAVIDLTTAYKDLAARAVRGAFLLDRRRVLIQDEFDLRNPCEVTWAMTTDAAIEVQGGTALLRLEGKELRAEALSPAGSVFAVESAERPAPEKTNAGVRRLILKLPGRSGALRVAVLLTPVSPETTALEPPVLGPLR